MKKIQILGTGCPKCNQLAENADRAARDAGIEFVLEKVKDLNDIMAFGVMLTPAIVVDGEVKAMGKVPSAEDIRQWLE